MGNNSLKSRICIVKKLASLGAYGAHMLNLWILNDLELVFE